MRIVKTEVVTRYCVEFASHECKILRSHPTLSLSFTDSLDHAPSQVRVGRATLTKSQLARFADALGINLREFMARAKDVV